MIFQSIMKTLKFMIPNRVKKSKIQFNQTKVSYVLKNKRYSKININLKNYQKNKCLSKEKIQKLTKIFH